MRPLRSSSKGLGRNLYLVGIMGSGKTTSGQLLAESLDWDLIDTDYAIELRNGKTIPQIFSQEGEDAFRSYEKTVFQGLASRTSSAVIATGGGAVLEESNIGALMSSGTVVYLHTSPNICWQRLAKTDLNQRPLLGETPNPLEKLAWIYKQRHEIYESVADYVVDTDKLSPNQASEKILELVQQ